MHHHMIHFREPLSKSNHSQYFAETFQYFLNYICVQRVFLFGFSLVCNHHTEKNLASNLKYHKINYPKLTLCGGQCFRIIEFLCISSVALRVLLRKLILKSPPIIQVFFHVVNFKEHSPILY